MLTFTTLSKQEFDDFARNANQNSIYQSSSWANVKSNWQPNYFGVKKENTTIAACLFLLRSLPFGFKFGYAPRGPLMNFEDLELGQFFFEHLRSALRKERVILAKLDPNILINSLPLEDKSTLLSQKNPQLIQTLKRWHCRHTGYTSALKESIQPRVQLAFPLEDIEERIPSKTHKKIRTPLKKGVLIKEEASHESLAKMIEYTQNRHHIRLRNPAYFKSILDHFKEDACVLSAYLDDVLISSCLLVKCKDTTEILYSGYHDEYKKTDSTYLLRYESIQWAKKHGCTKFNFGGVEGNLEDGLFMFKSSFNPKIDIYIGEFDLLTYPLLSGLTSTLFPFLKSRISF